VICNDNFQSFFSVDGAWGIIKQRQTSYGKVITIEILEGELEIKKIVSGYGESTEDDMKLIAGDTVEVSL
jgi:hypothetical protein